MKEKTETNWEHFYKYLFSVKKKDTSKTYREYTRIIYNGGITLIQFYLKDGPTHSDTHIDVY